MSRGYFFAVMLIIASATSSAQELSRAVQQGSEKGFKTCAPLLDRFVKHVHSDDSKYAHLGTWSKSDADRKMFSTLTVQPYSDGSIFAVFSGVRNVSERCDAVMTQVMPIPGTSCTALRETTFKSWKYLQDLGGVPIFEPPGDESTSVLLAPLGSGGCLIIKHAAGYE
jgi:hypothetical protein